MEPMKADRTEQEKLVELTEKLSTHNATHGKNVVFWSCKKCHMIPIVVKPFGTRVNNDHKLSCVCRECF